MEFLWNLMGFVSCNICLFVVDILLLIGKAYSRWGHFFVRLFKKYSSMLV